MNSFSVSGILLRQQNSMTLCRITSRVQNLSKGFLTLLEIPQAPFPNRILKRNRWFFLQACCFVAVLWTRAVRTMAQPFPSSGSV